MRYYIQVLKDARGNWNPFSFGGGYKNGGLTDEIVAKLATIFSPEYMGAAEYEFGALPKTLSALHVDRKNCSSHELSIPGHGTVWVYCRKGDWEKIGKDLPRFVDRKADLTRDPTYLAEALAGTSKTIGGISLVTEGYRNAIPFFYFTDKAAFDKMVALF